MDKSFDLITREELEALASQLAGRTIEPLVRDLLGTALHYEAEARRYQTARKQNRQAQTRSREKLRREAAELGISQRELMKRRAAERTPV